MRWADERRDIAALVDAVANGVVPRPSQVLAMAFLLVVLTISEPTDGAVCRPNPGHGTFFA